MIVALLLLLALCAGLGLAVVVSGGWLLEADQEQPLRALDGIARPAWQQQDLTDLAQQAIAASPPATVRTDPEPR